MTAADPEYEAWLAGIDEERRTRHLRLVDRHGRPEPISASDALALARTAQVRIDLTAFPGDVHASIYRDEAAADAWLEANLVHQGHPALARVPLPDGRVVGILDLRPEYEKAHARLQDPAYRAALVEQARLEDKT